MEFLELPLELVQRILYLSIVERGFERGVRLRLVNRYFSEQVHHVLFLHNMLDNGVLARLNMLPPFVAAYLEYRVLKEPTNGNQLLLCIRLVAERLTNDPQVARGYIKSLCSLVGQRVHHIFSRRQSPWEPLDLEDLEEHVKIAALYLKNEVHEHVKGYSCKLFGLSCNLVAEHGSKEIFKQWLEKGLSHITNRRSAFFIAARYGREDLIEISFNHKIESQPWRFDQSKKHEPESYEEHYLASALNTPNPKVWTFIRRLYQSYELIPPARQEEDLLETCARTGWTAMARHLLEQGTDPNSTIVAGKPLSHRILISAAQNGHTDIVQALIDFGAEIPHDIVTHMARFGHLAVLQILLKHVRPTIGAVVAAAKRGYGDVVELLLEDGGNANEDDGEIPAIGHAVLKEHLRMFQCLRKHGAVLPTSYALENCVEKAEATGACSMMSLLE